MNIYQKIKFALCMVVVNFCFYNNAIADQEMAKVVKMTEPNSENALPNQKISNKNTLTNYERVMKINNIILKVPYGEVKIELYPDKAPNHVERIKTLISSGFYNGLTFHRVIPGFMVQTGDPMGDGTGGSPLPNLNAEFNDIKHVRGVMSMARSADPNSANSQFFIMLGDSPHLDGQYTAFGKVVEGMEFIDQIKKGDVSNNGKVNDPDRIIFMELDMTEGNQ